MTMHGLALLMGIHSPIALQERYKEVPIYGSLTVIASTAYGGTAAGRTLRDAQTVAVRITYSGFDEHGKQITRSRGTASGQDAWGPIDCHGNYTWDRTKYDSPIFEVDLNAQRYRFRPYLHTPIGDVDCTETYPHYPPRSHHTTAPMEVPIPSSIDGQHIPLPGEPVLVLAPSYETGKIAGALNGTSATGHYDLDLPANAHPLWLGDLGVASTFGVLNPPIHVSVYWHLSTTPMAPCIAKVTFISGDFTLDGGPAYDMIPIEGQPRRAFRDVEQGQNIETGDHTRLELTMADGSVLRIGPNAKVNVGDLICGTPEERKVSMMMRIGEIWARIAGMVPRVILFEERHGNAAGPRGTTMEASVSSNGLFVVRVDEGHGFAVGGSATSRKEVDLEAGFCSSADSTHSPSTPYPCNPFFAW